MNVSSVRTLNNVIWIWILLVTELQLFLNIWQMGMVSGSFTTIVSLEVIQKNKKIFVHFHDAHFGYNFKNAESELIIFITPLAESGEQLVHL